MRNKYPEDGSNVASLRTAICLLTGAVGAACTITKGKGAFSNSTRTSAGLYTITLTDKLGGDLVGFEIFLLGAMADLRVNIVSYNATTGVLTFSTATHVAFTATDITNAYQVAIKLLFGSTVQG